MSGISGYMVFDYCDDWEQALRLATATELPPNGILVWRQGKQPATIFPSYKEARAAITRTHHFAKAYGRSDLPERSDCKIVKVEALAEKAPEIHLAT